MIKTNKYINCLALICLFITLILFIAGLWPFKFNPENEAKWLTGSNGVTFNGQGIIYSAKPVNFAKSVPDTQNAPITTIEILLKAETDCNCGIPRILSLYDGINSEYFFVGQWKSHLILRNYYDNQDDSDTYQEIMLNNILKLNRFLLITITSNRHRTIVYANGGILESFPGFSLRYTKNSSGYLLLGNAPTGEQYWKGEIHGLAIYNRILSDEQIARNYSAWMTGKSQLISGEGSLGLYLFNERSGTLISDSSGMDNNLILPETMTVLYRQILTPPWKDFHLNSAYLKDISINIAGFIPYGFLFSFLLNNIIKSQHKAVYILTITSGAVISLTIELIQIYLPTRSSSLSDFILNIGGTALGVVLYFTILRFKISTHLNHFINNNI